AQVELAIEAASVVILVVNVQEGVVPLDREAASRLRRSGKTMLLAVNKVDTSKAEGGMDDFAALGFEKMFPVSAIHGEGIEALMDAAMAKLKVQSPKPKAESQDNVEGRSRRDNEPDAIEDLTTPPPHVGGYEAL